MNADLRSILQECVAAVGAYLDQLVVAGGWVPYLYTMLYEEQARHEPLLTTDFDAALARQEFTEGPTTLDETILDAGFAYRFASLDTPPVVKYIKSLDGAHQAEIEFITEAARGQRDVAIIGPVNAQPLP